jgi:hypothetical protein
MRNRLWGFSSSLDRCANNIPRKESAKFPASAYLVYFCIFHHPVPFSDEIHCVLSDQLWWRFLCNEICAMEEADFPIPRAQLSVHLLLAVTSRSRRPVTWSSQNDKPQGRGALAASRWRRMLGGVSLLYFSNGEYLLSSLCFRCLYDGNNRRIVQFLVYGIWSLKSVTVHKLSI